MPYIKEKDREKFGKINLIFPKNPGELNYIISTIINSYLLSSNKLNYGRINECIGVLECVKQEVYRRIAIPYEDIKIEENGDVFSILSK